LWQYEAHWLKAILFVAYVIWGQALFTSRNQGAKHRTPVAEALE